MICVELYRPHEIKLNIPTHLQEDLNLESDQKSQNFFDQIQFK